MKKFKIFVLVVALLGPCISMADCCCRKIVDYMVVYDIGFNSSRIKNFSEEVKKAIKSGWKPFGGLVIGRYGDPYQAMVKYEESSQCD